MPWVGMINPGHRRSSGPKTGDETIDLKHRVYAGQLAGMMKMTILENGGLSLSSRDFLAKLQQSLHSLVVGRFGIHAQHWLRP